MTLLRRIIRAAGSLELTTVGLLYLFFLVFAMTLAQASMPVREATVRFMHSWLVFAGPVPFPGGMLAFSVLGANLIVATCTRIPLRWDRVGILLAHVGLILLVAGGLFSRLTVRETVIALAEGQSESFSYDLENWDLVVGADGGERYPLSSLPDTINGVRLAERQFLPDSTLVRDGGDSIISVSGARGIVPARVQRDSPVPGIILDVVGRQILLHGSDPRPLEIDGVGASPLTLQLLPGRVPLPVEIRLDAFEAEFFEGTQTPRAFSSSVTIFDGDVQRRATIEMNEPLRIGGHSIYQLGYDSPESSMDVSFFQIVRNPARWLPYVVGLLVSLGLIVHSVIRSAERRKA